MTLWKRAAERLREPSTMAGLAVLLSLCGAPDGVPELATQVVAGLAGIAAVLMREKGGP